MLRIIVKDLKVKADCVALCKKQVHQKQVINFETMVSGVINHNSYKKIISGCNILRNKMNINDQEKYQPASRSSI